MVQRHFGHSECQLLPPSCQIKVINKVQDNEFEGLELDRRSSRDHLLFCCDTAYFGGNRSYIIVLGARNIDARKQQPAASVANDSEVHIDIPPSLPRSKQGIFPVPQYYFTTVSARRQIAIEALLSIFSAKTAPVDHSALTHVHCAIFWCRCSTRHTLLACNRHSW